ncbi:hypothetical protein C9374_005493 [Naegleria lovaniensis]|uniref:Uncharacterized protein n=1 Tax=Naegleria lovaniensis TaxID=51637 RepID=A0AA88GJT8_NAELO|nr:uncharacterized protein C9374_005493 [Naegleria lovaniensis]KAG2382291.1 hypothetical protein C9374_005493 [Naegleria lovaniensis]
MKKVFSISRVSSSSHVTPIGASQQNNSSGTAATAVVNNNATTSATTLDNVAINNNIEIIASSSGSKRNSGSYHSNSVINTSMESGGSDTASNHSNIRKNYSMGALEDAKSTTTDNTSNMSSPSTSPSSKRLTPSLSQTFGEGGIEGSSNHGRRVRRGSLTSSLENEVHPVAMTRTMDQKVHLMEFLVQKRVENLDYLRRFHEGKIMWLNVVKVSPSEIENAYQPKELQKRLEQWLCLGVSLAPLINYNDGYHFVRACSQLMEEYEYHYSSMAMQGMKILKAFTNTFVDEETPIIPSQKTIKPVIHKSNGSVIYEFLQTPHIPCSLDYCQIVFSMCDILTFVYRKFLDETNINSSLHESIIKLDEKIKNNFIGLLSKDITNLAMQIVKTKLATVQNIFSISLNNQTPNTQPSSTKRKETSDQVDEWFEI